MGEVALMLLGKPNPGAKRNDWRYGDSDGLSVNPERGIWHDFRSGEGGGVLAFVKRETGRADARAWLRERGLLNEDGRPTKTNKAAPRANGFNGGGGGDGHDNKDAQAERNLNEARRIAEDPCGQEQLD